MISSNELLAIKARLLVAGEAAKRIVESNDQRIMYDEESYWRVHIALAALATDIAAMLTEIDTLRALFVDRVTEFFQAGGLNDAITSSSGDAQDAGQPVEGVPDPEGVSSSSPERADNAVVSSAAPTGRPPRRRKPRSKPSGDTAGLPISEATVE